jgi:hypothetical protein
MTTRIGEVDVDCDRQPFDTIALQFEGHEDPA